MGSGGPTRCRPLCARRRETVPRSDGGWEHLTNTTERVQLGSLRASVDTTSYSRVVKQWNATQQILVLVTIGKLATKQNQLKLKHCRKVSCNRSLARFILWQLEKKE